MQIKTIWKNVSDTLVFDAEVNHWLAEGWRLTRREVLPSEQYTTTVCGRQLYAELVKMDPAPEQPTMDPLEAVQVLARTCKNAPQCEQGICPLYDWCEGLQEESVPADWERSAENE